MTRTHLSSVAELWLGTMYRLRLVLCLVNKGVGAREEGSGVSFNNEMEKSRYNFVNSLCHCFLNSTATKQTEDTIRTIHKEEDKDRISCG